MQSEFKRQSLEELSKDKYTLTGFTFIKHYYSQQFEDIAHSKITYEVGEDASLTQMLDAFENFLKASGFVFDGYLDFVKDEELIKGGDPFVDETMDSKRDPYGVPTGYVPRQNFLKTDDYDKL
jgi:hypothetical protein